MPLDEPLSFRPVYKSVLWGGRRLAEWRDDLPEGPVGESWDVSDHPNGMSVVDGGAQGGQSLRALVERSGRDLLGAAFAGGSFPLLVKIIDAADRLSVQVHPDDALARAFGVADRGKTECWVFLADGGELSQGAVPGVDRSAFERALAERRLAGVLNRFEPASGDVFFLPARTVHALGAGCLVYEVQQTCDVTFRVYDWDRVGPDGRPRRLDVAQALATIDFAPGQAFGPMRPAWSRDAAGMVRVLADCATFRLEERQVDDRARIPLGETCAIVTCVQGEGLVSTTGGQVLLRRMGTVLVPASAGEFELTSQAAPVRLLLATPRP